MTTSTPKIDEAEIVRRKVSELQNWDKNPRTVDEKSYERLKQQILRLGLIYKPLLINQQDIVLGGNMRLRAFKDLGIEEVFCARVLTDNEAQMMELALSDNDQIGITDEEAVAAFNAIHPIKTELYAINSAPMKLVSSVVQSLSPEEATEDEAPEVSKEPPRSEYGKIYQLGRHRLMCGDATSTEHTEKLLDGNKVDLYLTDPPYNVDYTGKTKEALKIENDKKDDVEFQAFLADSFRAADKHLKPGGSFYIWHADSEGYNFRAAVKSIEWDVRQCLIWVKNSMVMGRQDYQWKHEPCLYGWKPGASHSWYSDRKQTTVLEFARPSRSEEHPTMKPVNLLGYQIQNSSKKDGIVLDPFLGSGSTLIACEQLDRICYAMEIDPQYCDVIRKRYAKFISNNQLPDNWEELTPAL